MKEVLPVVAIVGGVLLVVAGFLWGNIFPPSAAWSPQLDTKLSELGSELKGLGFRLAEAQANPSMHRGENPAEIKLKHDEVKAEYDALYAQFESARDRPANTGSTLKWLGIIVAGIGALFIFASRQQA